MNTDERGWGSEKGMFELGRMISSFRIRVYLRSSAVSIFPNTVVALWVLLGSAAASADVPEVTYVFPAGAQRGTTVDVRIGGLHLHKSCPIRFDGTGVVAPPTIARTETLWFESPVIPQPDSQKAEDYPSDYAARWQATNAAPLGVHWWRAETSQGVTASQAFVVGDLPEIVEQETAGEPIVVPVTTPVTINGRIFPREDVDVYSFRGVKGRAIRCEVLAARIGSPLDSQIEIYDDRGRRLAQNSDHGGPDSLLTFTPPADGEYQIRIFDAAFGGLQNYVYRLTLSDRPHVDGVYPLGGRRGAKTEFELTGVGIEGLKQTIALPKDAADDFSVAFKSADGRETNRVQLETSDVAELLEAEPNNLAEDTQTATLEPTCVANGRIDRAGDVDVWAFDAVKGEGIEFAIHAARLGSPLDSVLTVVDATGKELTTNDDVNVSEADSRVRFTPGADGRYFVRVADRSPHRGGRDLAYRLHAGPAGGGDFRLVLASDSLSLERGGTAKFKINVFRYGYTGDIQIVVDDLPDGVTFSGEKVQNGRGEATLNFKADDGLPVKLHACRVRGVGQLGDKQSGFTEFSRPASVAVGRGVPPLDVLHLKVGMKTPFQVVGSLELPFAHRGTYFKRHFNLERNGYTGPIEVRLAERQARHLQGVTGETITVPPDADGFDYAIYLPTILELGRTSRTVVTAVGEVVDEQGTKHTVSFSSVNQREQISLIIGPGPLTVEAEPATIAVATESPVDVTVRLDRDEPTPGPVRLELVVPRHIRGVTAEPIVVPAGATEGKLQIRFAADAGPFNAPLTVRAVHGSGRESVVAETSLEVVE